MQKDVRMLMYDLIELKLKSGFNCTTKWSEY